MSGEGSDHTVNNIRLSQDNMLYVLEIKELKKDSRNWRKEVETKEIEKKERKR